MRTPKLVADLNLFHFFHHFLPYFFHSCKSLVCAAGLVLVSRIKAVEKVVELAPVVRIYYVAQFVENHMLLKLQRHLRQVLAQTDFCRNASITKPPSFPVLAYAHYWVRYVWKFCRKLIPAILEHGIKCLIFFCCFPTCCCYRILNLLKEYFSIHQHLTI